MKIALTIGMISLLYATVMTSGFEKGDNQWTYHGTTFNTTTPISGQRSLRLNPLNYNSQQYAVTNRFFGSGVYVARIKIRFAVVPTITPLFLFSDGSAGAYIKDGAIYAGSASGTGATGVPVVAGVVYRIDLKIDSRANPWLIDVMVDGVPCGQFGQPSPGHTEARRFQVGDVNLYSFDASFDDFALSTTASDYPLGG